MSLFFKEFSDVIAVSKTKSWIHPSGTIAVLMEIVTDDSNKIIDDCCDYLDSIIDDENNSKSIFSKIQSMFPESNSKFSYAVFKNEGHKITWQINGNITLLQFNKNDGREMQMSGETICKMGTIYIAVTSNIKATEAARNGKDFIEAKSALDFSNAGKRFQKETGWSLLVFPFESKLSYINPAWPYNPFIGFQEDREHEKFGLYEIADSLFKEMDFLGFKIIGGNYFVTGQGTRLMDGILATPWGVFILELKHHSGKISLDSRNENQPMLIQKHHGGRVEEVKQTNPLSKMEKALRKDFLNFDLGAKIDSNLRRGGAIVFTNHNARVTCTDGSGKPVAIPCKVGNAVVATPSTLAGQLRAFTKAFTQHTQNFSNNPFAKLGGNTADAPPLAGHIIKQISDKLGRVEHRATTSENAKRKLGRFLIDGDACEKESTTYFRIYEGVVEGKDKRLWAKRFDISTMGKGEETQDEIDRILREVSALQDLSSISGVQKYWDKFTEGLDIYVILDRIEGETLDSWLTSRSQSRAEKLAVLVKIAETLHSLAEEKIVHRALKPFNIRINQDNKPTIINFELCQMASLATVLPKARELMDEAYQSRDALTPGCTVTPADDTYSFGKLCCLVLAGKLPFSSYTEQIAFVRKSDSWEKFGNDCGLDSAGTADLKRMLSNDRNLRPIGSELPLIVKGWQ